MGDHDVIALDNGVYKIWFARNYLAYQPNTVLLDNALATMGAGLPSAMMAAVLQAPLAALMTVLELTMNPNVILPAMLIIVVATLVTGEVFKQKSIYLSMLATLGLQYPPNAVTLHLQRAGLVELRCVEPGDFGVDGGPLNALEAAAGYVTTRYHTCEAVS